MVAIIISTYGLAVALILVNFKDKLTEDAKQVTISYLNENASNARAIINGDFEIARMIAATLSNTINFENTIREDLTGKLLTSTVNMNKRYLSAWVSVELSAVDYNWLRPYGRKRYTYYQLGVPVFDTVNRDGDVKGSLYHTLKQSKEEALLEPYLLSSTSSVKDARNDYMGTSVCVPLLKDGIFLGLAGMDITLEALNFIADIKPYPGSTSFLVSNEGMIVAHEQDEYIGKSLTTLIARDSSKVMSDIRSGNGLSWISSERDALVAFTPLPIANSKHPWSIGTIVPMSAITSTINPILWKTVIISVIGLMILIISVYTISAGITKPIKLVNERLKELAKGNIRKNQAIKSDQKDEIGEMIQSVNTLEENMNEKINFAVEIGSGKFDTAFATAGTEDTLGMALQTMRNNLRQFREEDEKRKWSNEGLAKLNDILRLNTSGNSDFYFQVLKTLINFLKANQGGIFLIEEDEAVEKKYIELVAAYAYERRKHLNAKLPWGDGLIGQCVIEKDMIYLKEIPKGYIKITSGLGEATPGVLVIVPLKTDTEVVGAIEIAAFAEFKEHELQFIQRASDIIAASIYSYRNAERTQALLSKAQTIETEMKENKIFFN